jgi:hypothetical protein
MKFFKWFGFEKVMEDTEPKNVVKLPVDYIKPAPEPEPKEHYRVGFTDDGKTTLTLIADHGNTMTLTMSQEACEQLIRILRSTYIELEYTEGDLDV